MAAPGHQPGGEHRRGEHRIRGSDAPESSKKPVRDRLRDFMVRQAGSFIGWPLKPSPTYWVVSPDGYGLEKCSMTLTFIVGLFHSDMTGGIKGVARSMSGKRFIKTKTVMVI